MIKKIIFSAIVFVFFFGVLELFFVSGDFIHRKSPGKLSSLKSPRSVILKKLPGSDILINVPNQDFVDTTYDCCPYKVKVNSHGFRGRETTVKKPPNVTRIAIFGDSFVYGAGEDDERTLSWYMEKKLNRGYLSPRFEVLNAGVTGSTITDELELYRVYLGKFKPDIVIVGYSWNDMLDIIKREENELVRSSVKDSLSGINRVFMNSAFARFLTFQYAKYIRQKMVKHFYTKQGDFNWQVKIETIPKGKSPVCEGAIDVYEKSLLTFREIAEGDNAKFIFFIYPTRIDEHGILRDIGKELEEFALGNQIPVVNLKPLWLSGNRDIFSFFNPTEHPTDKANKFTADILVKLIEEKGFVWLCGGRGCLQRNLHT